MLRVVGMYCFHSPVVKCQKIANNHSPISVHAAMVCRLPAFSQPNSR